MSDLDQDRLKQELQTLGEDAPTQDELTLATADGDDAVDVAVVAALVGISEPLENAELSEMSQARAWRKVEGRLGLQAPRPAAAQSARRRPWAMVAVGLAAAAAVTFIIVRPGPQPDGEHHEMAIALQTQARQGLSTLGVEPGGESARAQQMLADYEARMEGAG